jgi:CRP-like cAMP-binding protein/tetratricopeptide (TPR) repeat protein
MSPELHNDLEWTVADWSGDLSDEGRATLVSLARTRSFGAGEVVCRQGDRAGGLHLITAGRAAVRVVTPSGLEVTVGVLVPGDMFGEQALSLAAARQLATVSALETLETLALSREALVQLRVREPAVADTVTRLLVGRVAALSQALVEALSAPAETRVLSRLVSLVHVYGDERPVTVIPLTQEELASSCGLVRATVNRVLRREHERGTLRVGRGKVTVLDVDALVSRAGEAARAETAGTRPPPGVSPGAAPLAAEREAEEERVVTVLHAALGWEAWNDNAEESGRLAARYHEALSAAARRYGAPYARFTGHRMTALFGLPNAGVEDPAYAVRAGWAICEQVSRLSGETGMAIEVSVAVESARLSVAVNASADEMFDQAAGLAEAAIRFQAAAKPGTVLVGDETYRATRRSLSYRQAQPSGWLLVAPPDRGQRSFGAPFVARDAELDLLCRLWHQSVEDRRPRLCTLLGVAGIGKTRLAAEMASIAAREGGRVLRGRSLPYGENAGYGAFAQQVQSMAGISGADDADTALGKLAACLKPERRVPADSIIAHLGLMIGVAGTGGTGDRSALFVSARQLIEEHASRTATLMVFEDAHWAEDTLLDLVEFLAGRTRDTPVLFAVLARPELLDRRPHWAGGLPSATSIELDGLGVDAARHVATHHLPPDGVDPTLLTWVISTAEGNPLFLEELAAAVAERPTAGTPARLPTTIVTAIGARLDTLQPAQRAVLLNASVIGKVFWRSTVERLGRGGNLAEVLDALEQRGFIRRDPVSHLPGDDQYSFRHILIREVAYSRLSGPARAHRHRAAARVLESAAQLDTSQWATLLAYHFTQSGDSRRALHHIERAASRASDSAAHREAASLLTTALDLASESAPARVAQLHRQRGVAYARVGDWPAARADLETGAAQPEAAIAERVATLIELAMVCHWQLDLDALRSHTAEALRLAENAGRTDLAAAATGALGWADSSEGHIATSMEHFDVAISHADQVPRALLGPIVEVSALSLYWMGRPAESVERAQMALAIGRRSNDSSTVIRSLGNLVMALAASGRYGDAFNTFEQAREFSAEVGTAAFLARAIEMCAGVHLDLADFDAAEALALEAAERAEAVGFPLPVVSGSIDLIFIHTRSGHPERAAKLITGTARAVRGAQGAHGWLWRMRLEQARAELSLAKGDPARAMRSANRVLRQARQTGRIKYQVAAVGCIAQALSEQEHLEEAAPLAQSAVELARTTGDPAMLLRAASLLLHLNPNPGLHREALLTASRITQAVPDLALRQRIQSSPLITDLA